MLGVIRTWSSSEMKLWKIGTMTCCSEQQINRTCRCFGAFFGTCFNKKPVDEVHDSCPFSWKWANFTSCFWFQFHWLSCFMCFFVDYPTSTQPKYCIISTTLEYVLTTHAMKFFNKKIPCNSWSTLPYGWFVPFPQLLNGSALPVRCAANWARNRHSAYCWWNLRTKHNLWAEGFAYFLGHCIFDTNTNGPKQKRDQTKDLLHSKEFPELTP